MTALTDSLAEGAVQAVLEAGELLTDPAAVQSIRSKGETDYVTNVDVAVQAFLRERLVALAPDVQFMGEEQDNTGLDWSRPCWILDPVDGTTNLIHSFRHSAISLALAEGGQVVFGVVYNPYTEECFTARRGGGALRNGVPIQVSAVSRLEDSLLSAGTVPGQRELADAAFRQMRALYDRCQDGLCQPGAVRCGLRTSGGLCGAVSPAVGLRRRNAHLSGGRGTGYRSGRSPSLSGGGRASVGLQWAAPQRTANNFERMRVLSWTCAFPPPLGS